ncbi:MULTISPECIES: glucose-1-phosphate cytidylyltransferase [unclassified Roseobacter]|uniref:glucose-1-phosphate cytidylyltransferase n=1 Tax=unclassified Roseobacter TaxID=196798 RepID=UPI0030EC87B0
MKVVLLAGGYGTRLSEETDLKPKPMLEIGGKPILWHIMKIYSTYGLNDFIICCGYKGYAIKEYFSNYFLHQSDVTFDLGNNSLQVHQNKAEPWSVTLVDTGEDTMTGGRLKRIRSYLNAEEDFCFTYGDGVGDINIPKLIDFHRAHGLDATLTATRPPGRYGALKLTPDDGVERFVEKPEGDGSWINCGFFILKPRVIDRIEGDETSWEKEPLEQLAFDGSLAAFKHTGFWQPMDTIREKKYLNDLWNSGAAPWKVWK